MTVTMEVLSALNLHMFHLSSDVSTSRLEGFSHAVPPFKRNLESKKVRNGVESLLKTSDFHKNEIHFLHAD